MLAELAKRYRQELDSSVIPFWLEHSLDHERGGQFSCLDRDGSLYDTKKYLWLQGRGVWTFSRLYNEWDRRRDYLDAAELIFGFMHRFGEDDQGRSYFSVTADGAPYFTQRKPYAAVFRMLGLLEYSRATQQQRYLDEAIDLFWRIGGWIADPATLGRPALIGQVPVSQLADVMVQAGMALELMAVHDDPRYQDVIAGAIAAARRHFDVEHRVLVENVALDGRSLREWPEGRLVNPGHSIEVAWFLLHMLERFPDAEAQRMALDALEGSLELGWDHEFDGLTYMMDIEGKPLLQLEAPMKLWWPHVEAIYALVLASVLTGEDRWTRWLERIDSYSFTHFADPEFGEWFGYCDRGGRLTSTLKGNNYKGFFHIPRALMMSVQRIEQAEGTLP